MGLVQVVKTSFGDFANAKFATNEIIFFRIDGKNQEPAKKKDIAGTYWVNQKTALPPETSPEIHEYFKKALKTCSSGLEVFVIFENDRWLHVRTGDIKMAKEIHGIKPDDRPRPSSSGDDDGNGRD